MVTSRTHANVNNYQLLHAAQLSWLPDIGSCIEKNANVCLQTTGSASSVGLDFAVLVDDNLEYLQQQCQEQTGSNQTLSRDKVCTSVSVNIDRISLAGSMPW